MIKAVFIDIDDTLTNSDRKISDENKAAIKKCIEKGIIIILASGRSRKAAIDFQKEIGSSPYIISSNGASCYDCEKNVEIYNEILDKEIVKKLLEHAIQNDYKININFKDRLVINQAFFPDEVDNVVEYEELKRIAENEEVVQCVMISKDFEKIKQFKKDIENNEKIEIINQSKRLKNEQLEPSKSYYCDISSKNVSKGKAVKKVCEYLNLKPEEIVTIGDGENDISMFETTPNSVAMGNAVEKAKANAKYETTTNNENGVAKVLNYILNK